LRYWRAREVGIGIGVAIGIAIAIAIEVAFGISSFAPTVRCVHDTPHAHPHPFPRFCVNPSTRDVRQILQVGRSSSARSVRLVRRVRQVRLPSRTRASALTLRPCTFHVTTSHDRPCTSHVNVDANGSRPTVHAKDPRAYAWREHDWPCGAGQEVMRSTLDCDCDCDCDPDADSEKTAISYPGSVSSTGSTGSTKRTSFSGNLSTW
jgi:hypothetical protein